MSDIGEVKELLDGQKKLFEEYKGAVDELSNQVKNLGSEDAVTAEKVTKLDAAIEEITTKLSGYSDAEKAAAERMDTLEAAMSRPDFGKAEGEVIDEAKAEHQRAFNQWVRKGNDAALSAAEAAAFESKALSAGSDPDGGYLAPTTMDDRVISIIYETSPMRSVASVMTIGTGDVEFLVDKDEAASGGWVSELGSRSETNTPQLAMAKITVHEQFAEPRASQKILDDASFDVEGWLARKIADKLARTENTAFVTGTGAGQPRGFTTYPSGTSWQQIEQVATGDASDVTADSLIDIQNTLKDAYQVGATWAMKRSSVANIRKLKTTDNQYLWQPGLSAETPENLLGHPIVRMDDMAAIAASALPIAYGNFNIGYTVVDRTGIRVLRDPFTAKPQVKFYTTKRVGGDVLNFEAIKLLLVSA